MKRLYAFKTIKQILGLIDKSAGYSDAEKRRALDLALENNFVTSLTSLVVTGQEDPVVIGTRKKIQHTSPVAWSSKMANSAKNHNDFPTLALDLDFGD